MILLRPLEDKRLEQLRPYVGGGVPVPGMPPEDDHAVVLDGDRELVPVLTDCVSDALRAAGYETVRESGSSMATPDGILRGEIDVFWVQASSNAVWHTIQVTLRLMDSSGGEMVWTGDFRSRKTRSFAFFFRPSREDLEAPMRGALDKLLQELTNAFASEQFYLSLAGSAASD